MIEWQLSGRRRLPSYNCTESFLAPCKLIRILESGKSWALESVIQFQESRLLLTIKIRNPSSTDKESGIQYLESGINSVQ